MKKKSTSNKRLTARAKTKLLSRVDERVTEHQQGKDSLPRVLLVTSSSVHKANSEIGDNLDSTDTLGTQAR